MPMTHEQMWTRFRNIVKREPSDFKVKCHICDKEIKDGDPDIEYVKTKSGSELFMHRRCAMNWGGGWTKESR